MRDKVVPLKRLQEEVKKAYEESNNKLVIKKEGLVVKEEIYPWEKLKPIKLEKSFGGLVEIKTLHDEIVFSSRTTAITRVPLFEALYNSMIKERNQIYYRNKKTVKQNFISNSSFDCFSIYSAVYFATFNCSAFGVLFSLRL